MFLLDILYISFVNYLIFNMTFYISNFLLFLIDYFKLFVELKIQKNKLININIDSIYKKIFPLVLQNSLLSIIPAILVMGMYELTYFENINNPNNPNNYNNYNNTNCSESSNNFHVSKFVYDIIIARLLSEIFFYCTHRLCHINYLYQSIHKLHHEITIPIGLSALYMTIADLYIGNIIPTYLPMLILQCHPVTIKFWMITTTLNAVIFAHSGFQGLANSHDYHHSHFNKNYGTDLFMDKIFGTYYDETINN